MEKFLKIGERYVQWIALSLGALYLGLMAYNYVLTPPITVPLDKKEFLPGQIDQQIRNEALKRIESDMNSTKRWADPKPVNPAKPLQVAFVDNAPPDVPLARAKGDILEGTTRPSGPTAGPTIAMAPAPVPSPMGPATGTSQVNEPQPVPAAAANPAVAAVAPVQPVLAPKDYDWVTFPWTVDAKALNAAFEAAHIPNVGNVFQTAFLRVQVVREEVLPNGKLGPPLVLNDIPTVTLEPMPLETAPVADKLTYLNWAADHAADILTPPFFSVTYGTNWYPPGAQKPNDVFPPAGAALPVAPLPQQQLPAPRAPGIGVMPPHGVRNPGMPPPAVAPGLMPRGIIGRQPPVPPPAMQPGGFGPGVVQGPGAAGFINPAQVPDITIYTHDWTVQAGHSYRYKMCYTISNPLFGVQQADVKQADRDHLTIVSPYSVWTAPIDIPSRFKFWVQKFQRNGKDEVTFDLFRRTPGAPGGLERSTIRASPGDSIGPSPWLLVDVRQDAARRSVFLIADPNGNIERHELEKDKTDPDHLEMLDRTGASAAAIGG